ncbi:MAG: alpha/beta fold hydrolase [Bacteroidota bacterium]
MLRLPLTLCVLLIATALHAQPAAPPLTLEPYTFTADDGRSVEAEKGTFRVPERRADADSRTIELAFVRFASTSDHPGPPIVYLAGGPGGSGSSSARYARFDLFMAMREVADVIAFDQRGTGLSEQLPNCPHQWRYPLDQPGTRHGLTEVAREAAEACVDFWRGEGVDLDGYTSTESADDLESLRQVLGVDQISLWSISYGSHLALAMLKRHPDRIDRAILAGVEGPDHTSKRPADQQALLHQIDAWVQADSVLSPQLPSLTGAIATMLARLEEAPVVAYAPLSATDSVAVTIGPMDLQLYTAYQLGGPSSFKHLPKTYLELLNGDFSSVAPTVFYGLRSGGFRAMPLVMDIASGISDERRLRIEAEREQTLLGDAINVPATYELAASLDLPDLGEAYRAPTVTDVPVLLISGTLDGRTPPRNAEEVRAGLPNSVHLILDGAGHSDPLFLSSPRIEAVMKAFLLGRPVYDEVVRLPPVTLSH